jgi:hypothetical protein
MSFIGQSTELKIKTSTNKTFKIFLTEQVGGYWVATVLYAENGTIKVHHETNTDKTETYRLACEWVMNNIDENATIDTL